MHAKRLFIPVAVCLVVTAASTASLLAQQSWTSGTFSYDAAGNITAIGSDTYFYDTAGRIVHGTAEGPSNFQEYSYDGFGNRLTADTTGKNCSGNAPCGGSVASDASNRITTSGFSYDAAGNMQTSGGNTYGYDGAGMMSSLTAPNGWRYDYIYTADDERIATYTGGGNWQFTFRGLDGKVLREMTAYQPAQGAATWTWSHDHVWRDGRLLATVSPSGTQQFHLDHLGTPRLVTDAAGYQIGYHAYYPFGEELNLGTDEYPAERLKFTGHERDALLSSSLDYMHARFASAALGRFLSVDPLIDWKKALARPQMWNRYTYVTSNPVDRLDPNGKAETDLTCVPADICNRPGVREAVRNGQTQALKWGLAIDTAIIGGAELPLLGRAAMTWLGLAAAGGGGTALLGENMVDRVGPLAEEMQMGSGSTFNQPWAGTLTEMLAKNMTWLQSKIDSGSRILDIGRDLTRANPSPFYSAEVNLLQQNGYERSFVELKMVNGALEAVYEWTMVK
jgi:RHS repeat-associated protein